jgi:hypothetical protein
MALATCCYHVGEYEAGVRYCDELLENPQSMPWNIQQQILVNRQQCAEKIADSYSMPNEHLPKIKVFVAFRDFGPHLDNCIDGLLVQTGGPFEMVFLDLGSTRRSSQQIPIDDPRVRLLHRSEGENIWSFVASHCEDDDLVLLLNGGDWLISEDALARLQKCFADPACLVTYGQFQYADGAPGLACWIPGTDSERLLTDDWRCTYPLAVRGSLLKQVVRERPIAATSKALLSDPHDEGFSAEEHVALARKLLAAAGPAEVRFNADPICVYDSETKTQNSSVEVQSSGPSISNGTLPTISCLTVALDRLVLLKEAIHCYCRQTYPNKELIIVTNGDSRYRQAIGDYISWLGRNDIRLVCAGKAGEDLSALRNVSLDAARGTIMCQWNNGDLNHPQRLERQFEHLSAAKADGCCFTDQLRFFFRERLLYWSDWKNLIPDTLMTYRDKQYLFEQLAESGTVTPFQDAGFLNVSSHQGEDVFSQAQHQLIAVCSSRSVDFVREHESILRAALRHYRLPEPYTVATGDGPIMSIQNQVFV